jgi:protein arginine N-methyltransferase 1
MDGAATVYGFAVWWEAQLAPGVLISTAPGAARTHWEQLYFPLAAALTAAAGETVQISLRSRSSPEGGTHLAWTATLADDAGKVKVRYAHDLDKGYLP